MEGSHPTKNIWEEGEGVYYSTIGIITMFVLLIENYDILLLRATGNNTKAWKIYRVFLIGVIIYLTTDILWGFLEQAKLTTALFIDTQVYYVAMGLGIVFWTQFAVAYLDEKGFFSRFLVFSGGAFFTAVVVMVIMNNFTPILFWIDEDTVYHPTQIRYAMLIVQILLLIVLSLHTYQAIAGRNDSERRRYRSIGAFGIIMSLFLTVQLWFPLLPLYSIAYMLGTCLLHTFVVNDEKEEYKAKLEKALEREKKQYEELKNARILAYRDPLTGVKSKLAYAEAEERKDAEIKGGTTPPFAVAVFDINDLKLTNDKYGHEQGDKLITRGCMLICTHFKHSPVFRIGGDEFVAILEYDDFNNREKIIGAFNALMNARLDPSQARIAIGISEYDKRRDLCFNDVFVRADKLMYERKRELKENDVSDQNEQVDLDIMLEALK
ncbi:MAG: GGDEF domain-containing protein [Ruminococcus sp.]|nr:GGDEF domain-containing protein [Ruminococcus sp.]